MKSILKLIRRFAGVLLVSFILILILNIVVFVRIASDQTAGRSPWTTAVETAENLQKTENGYMLSEDIAQELRKEEIWAVYIDNDTHKVVWNTENLPDEIPLEYSISEIAFLTRGYVKDYPTFTGGAENGLIVLGYPKDRYWKEMYPSWDYSFIKHLPQTILIVLFCNIALILLIYMVANMRILKTVRPIAEGIQVLPMGESVQVKEKGLLSELASKINRTSEVLQSQKHELKKKDIARANWIAGVSHDIRTPLSMVMGYASQLEQDCRLTEEERNQAAVIVKQSEKIKQLISDLNLASKLEYNMQPVKSSRENAVALVRQVVVDFINVDIENRYPIEWMTEDTVTECTVNADRELLKRAVCNLIQNCMNHNQNGCIIYVTVKKEKDTCMICVEDNGVGVSEEQIEQLNYAPHYIVCDENTTVQRHGLGLLIVKQIMDSHGGEVIIGHSVYGGFCVKILLPLEAEIV